MSDAIITVGNVNPNEYGKMVILPAALAGSPGHMHDYAQNAMARFGKSTATSDYQAAPNLRGTGSEARRVALVSR